MTATSYNGWPASEQATQLGVVRLAVGGVEFVGGVKGGDVHTVLEYVATQFHTRIEPLVNPGCWGWSYRQNRNADNLSCHSSGTAIDCNAPQHPNGVPVERTFTQAEIAKVHAILASVPELDEVVHWGGDWSRANGLTPDSMHFEIHGHDTAQLARVAARIRNPQPRKDWSDMATKEEFAAVLEEHLAPIEKQLAAVLSWAKSARAQALAAHSEGIEANDKLDDHLQGTKG